MQNMKIVILLGFLLLNSTKLDAAKINLAVASNFKNPISTIANRFEQKTGHKVALIFGSTGKHYAQIKNLAPFDILLAADSVRPELLETEGLAIAGSRFTYAIGKLVLWSPKARYVDANGKVLTANNFKYLAIANPQLAPYGKAAKNLLIKIGLWHTIKKRLIQGENISQTFQFVKSLNAELGLVAYSQIKNPDKSVVGSFWLVPQNLYPLIEQQAILLKDSPAARQFISFMQEQNTLRLIRDYGYDTANVK